MLDIDIEEISNANYCAALDIIKELKIEEIWGKHNSKANLVGSVKTKLLMNHLDIDYHIYSDDFSIEKSFSAIGEIANNPKVSKILYINSIEKEDRCLEWHLDYVDDKKRLWQIDMIHILNDSPYVGKFERVAEKMNHILTDEIRNTILRIKWELAINKRKAMGIEVCKAVIKDNILKYSEFLEWQEANKNVGILKWEPEIPIH